MANVTLPAGFEQLTKPATTLEFTPAEVAAQRQAWISEWQRAVSVNSRLVNSRCKRRYACGGGCAGGVSRPVVERAAG